MVNIREHDSWVHTDRDEATAKAKSLAHAAIRRVRFHRALETAKVPIHPDVLVVGRRHFGHSRGHHLGQRGQEGFPRRARTEHRRAHGQIRQNLSHARLRRVHSHAQDVRRPLAREHHALDVFGNREGRGLRRQLHGDRETQTALRERGVVRRLPGMHQGVRVQGRQVPG